MLDFCQKICYYRENKIPLVVDLSGMEATTKGNKTKGMLWSSKHNLSALSIPFC